MNTQSQSQSLALFEALQHLRLVTYFNISATALYVFDYLLTLESEVELIWGSNWTVTKFVYLITRYLPFIDMGFLLWHDNTPNMTVDECILADKLNGGMFTAGIVLAEVILTLRTWAVWKRHRFLTVGMLTLFLASSVAVFAVMGIVLYSLRFQILPFPDFKGCFISASTPVYLWTFIILMIYEVVVLLLMALKSYLQFREAREIGSSQLLKVVLKDGIIYYLYLSVLNVINMIVIHRLTPDLCILLAFFERVIHAMLACRVVTNIRAQARRQLIIGSSGTLGDLGTVTTLTFAAGDAE